MSPIVGPPDRADGLVADGGSSRLQRHVLVHPATWGEAQLLQLRSVARGTKLRSSGCWIEYFPGTGGLVIAAPHDGLCKPPQIPVRSFGVTVRDTGTQGLAASLALELLWRRCARPHLLVCHLSRRCLDVNRARELAAAHEGARSVWDAYHELLSRACAAAAAAGSRSPGGSLLLDVHAQSHWRHTGIEAIEVGTLVPSSFDLEQGDAHLEQFAAALRDQRSAGCGVVGGPAEQPNGSEGGKAAGLQQRGFTMPRLAASSLLSGSSLAELIRGPESLGSILAAHGLLATPSQALPAPCRPAVSGNVSSTQLQAAAGPDGESSMQPLQGALPVGDSERTSASSAGEEDTKVGRERSLFFSGSSSYVLATYPGVLDCVQLECPSRLTRNRAGWKRFACSVLDSLAEFWRLHTKKELFAPADRAELLAVMAAEPGAKAKAYRFAKEAAAPLPPSGADAAGSSMEALCEAARYAEIATSLLTPDLSRPTWSTIQLPLEEPAESGLLARCYAVRPTWSTGPLDIWYFEMAWRGLDFVDLAAARFEPPLRNQLLAAADSSLVEEQLLAESGDALMTVMSRERTKEHLEVHLLLNLLDDEPLRGILHWVSTARHSALFPGTAMPTRSDKKKRDFSGVEFGIQSLYSPLSEEGGCKLRCSMFLAAEARQPSAESQRAHWVQVINRETQKLQHIMVECRKHALQCPRAGFYRLCRANAERHGLPRANIAATS